MSEAIVIYISIHIIFEDSKAFEGAISQSYMRFGVHLTPGLDLGKEVCAKQGTCWKSDGMEQVNGTEPICFNFALIGLTYPGRQRC